MGYSCLLVALNVIGIYVCILCCVELLTDALDEIPEYKLSTTLISQVQVLMSMSAIHSQGDTNTQTHTHKTHTAQMHTHTQT